MKTKKKYMIGKYKGTDKPYYGVVEGSKVLVNSGGKWRTCALLGCGEGFTEDTKTVSEKEFNKTMLSLGVPQAKIDEFIAYEINWENF